MQYLLHPIGFHRPASEGPRETVHAIGALLDEPALIELLDVLLEVWVQALPDEQLCSRYAEALGRLSHAENVALMSVYQTDDEQSGRAELVRTFPAIAEPEVRREAVKLAEGLWLTELLEHHTPIRNVIDECLNRLSALQVEQAAVRALGVYARRFCGTPN